MSDYATKMPDSGPSPLSFPVQRLVFLVQKGSGAGFQVLRTSPGATPNSSRNTVEK